MTGRLPPEALERMATVMQTLWAMLLPVLRSRRHTMRLSSRARLSTVLIVS